MKFGLKRNNYKYDKTLTSQDNHKQNKRTNMEHNKHTLQTPQTKRNAKHFPRTLLRKRNNSSLRK